MNARMMSWCISVCVVVLFMSLPTESGVANCRSGQFFNGLTCQNCRKCPQNNIIRKPCSEDTNTICGPFREFINFQQSRLDNQYVDPEHTHPKHHKHPKHHSGHHNSRKNNSKSTPELHIEAVNNAVTHGSSRGSVVGLTSAVSSAEQQWKTLAMALIGILSVVSVALVMFVFTVCYIRHKRRTMEKEIIYDPEMMECHPNTYVQVQPYVSSRDRLKSKSNIRALREFQQSAYDSGSDDSCGSAPTPSSVLLGQPVIGQVSDDYDADHSGQTITTTKSSDYVYFNSPQNANGVP